MTTTTREWPILSPEAATGHAVELSRQAQRLEARAEEAWEALGFVLRHYGPVIDREAYARLTAPEEAAGA